MHAKHADNSELNEPLGRRIGCVFTVLQGTNYPQATGLQLCLLLNFGKPCLEIKRVVHGLSAAPSHPRVLRASPSFLHLR